METCINDLANDCSNRHSADDYRLRLTQGCWIQHASCRLLVPQEANQSTINEVQNRVAEYHTTAIASVSVFAFLDCARVLDKVLSNVLRLLK